MSSGFGLITGCGKGIGLSITNKLLIENKDIKVLGISRTINNNIKKIQKEFQNRFIFYERDICENQEIYKLLEYEQKNYIPLSFAICNAGVRSRKSIKKSDLNLYRSIIETNAISNINIAKKVIETNLMENSKCNILLISSIVGARGFDELSTYAVSKSALEGFMRSAAVEYGNKGIQINCLAPGFVESSYADNFKKNNKELYEWTISQTPMRRWGKCEEIADLAIFLISNKNSYMTGSVIYSDGGWTAK
tara:strand:- start:400 stop:1149 length:750 start_codon:yes stop_codon:yes gene_type:complete